jgi:hypothetical protein
MTKKYKIFDFADDTRLVQSSSEFIEGFVPPDYLINGLLQRRYLYSITAQTGSGKTAICLLLSAHIAQGLPLGNNETAKGRVLYLAGENPDDIRMRWTAMAQQLGIDPGKMEVYFVPGAQKLSQIASRIAQEMEECDLSLVVIDTSAAYYEGDDENNNVQAGTHARRLRELVKLPGGPTVLVCCHPTKNAGDDNLLPRGGGAFIAEVDGNLTCKKNGNVVELHCQGKFRGPDFSPLQFQLKTVTHERLKDSRGRLIPTVVALHLSEESRQAMAASSRRDEDLLLKAIAENQSASPNILARLLGWFMKDGAPYRMKVNRAANALKKQKMICHRRDAWELTPAGRAELKRLAEPQPCEG